MDRVKIPKIDCETPKENSPEKALLVALVVSAILDYSGHINQSAFPEAYPQVFRARATRWLFSESNECSPETGITFLFACEALGISPKRLRVRIERNEIDVIGLIKFMAWRDPVLNVRVFRKEESQKP